VQKIRAKVEHHFSQGGGRVNDRFGSATAFGLRPLCARSGHLVPWSYISGIPEAEFRGQGLQRRLRCVSLNRILVPINTDSSQSGYLQHPLRYFIGLFQDWIYPVLPFEPVRRFRNPHNVGADLWIKVRGDGDARRRCNRGRS
jgi:hypothetical protein